MQPCNLKKALVQLKVHLHRFHLGIGQNLIKPRSSVNTLQGLLRLLSVAQDLILDLKIDSVGAFFVSRGISFNNLGPKLVLKIVVCIFLFAECMLLLISQTLFS